MRVEELGAGKKLNLLVAMELMGWYRVSYRMINNVDQGEGLWHDSFGDPMDPHGGANAMGPPGYVYNIRDAFAVMRKFGIALIPQSNDRGGFDWLAIKPSRVVYDGDVTIALIEDYCMSSPDAPHAICICALLANGIKEVRE